MHINTCIHTNTSIHKCVYIYIYIYIHHSNNTVKRVLFRHPSLRTAERPNTLQTNIRGARYPIRRMDKPYPWNPWLPEIETLHSESKHEQGKCEHTNCLNPLQLNPWGHSQTQRLQQYRLGFADASWGPPRRGSAAGAGRCSSRAGGRCPRKRTSKGTGRQGMLSKHRNSLQKNLCPVVIPYLCSSGRRQMS